MGYNRFTKEEKKMELKGSKTEKNLMDAFAGESQARNKYTYYASKAKKEGYEQIAAIFLETADNEKEHAKLWFKEFHGIGTTTENLIDAAAGEHAEWTDMYNWMADEADAEGFHAIAARMRGVAAIERNTRRDTSRLPPHSKRARSSRRTASWHGSAATADTSISARKPPRCAPCAHIRERTSK